MGINVYGDEGEPFYLNSRAEEAIKLLLLKVGARTMASVFVSRSYLSHLDCSTIAKRLRAVQPGDSYVTQEREYGNAVVTPIALPKGHPATEAASVSLGEPTREWEETHVLDEDHFTWLERFIEHMEACGRNGGGARIR